MFAGGSKESMRRGALFGLFERFERFELLERLLQSEAIEQKFSGLREVLRG
jgi:hypothetical protein